MPLEFTIRKDPCPNATAILRCERDKLIVNVESGKVYKWTFSINGNKQDLESHEVVNSRPSFILS